MGEGNGRECRECRVCEGSILWMHRVGDDELGICVVEVEAVNTSVWIGMIVIAVLERMGVG